VEAMRCRGIYPPRVTSLADSALSWPAPDGLHLHDDPNAVIDLRGWILSATMDLDPTGVAGDAQSVPSGEDPDEPTPPADSLPALGEDGAMYGQVVRWARAHAAELGFDNRHPIALRGVHVAYRQAADRQPRPEIVMMLTQRRRDLEDQTLDEKHRPIFRAGTTLITGVDGRVEFMVAKPLPLTQETLAALPANHVGRQHHQAGEERLRALRDWIEQVEDSDALSAWTNEPALNRLSFAALHGDEAGRTPS